ncbi:di/tricarboxylate transporter [Allocatelliglobosispora scoriae]|uniref:Di/tricarboxylate transporter n=1 Tax=Allocatelliglobosispora scoriae TaxID=643052 RepID=A0A841BQ54_9ACTN|nr:SLC13 family permease [Allocatelliglobosispora scoriae]MBB5868961.1 di/tricarboxylate transporter [Allocatelliglobosispora scoriae]
MSQAGIAFTVLGAVIVLFVWNRLPVEIVALGAALALFLSGVLGVEQIFAGFGDPVIIFIASLFVVSEALDATGVTAWAGQELISRTGTSRPRQLLLTMLLVACLTALISVNGAVAALLPMVVVMAVRLGRSPSGLVMPLAFAAHAGSLLALTGTPINVIASEAAQSAGGDGFGFFSFALVGIPLVLGVCAIAVLFGDRLLPQRRPKSIPPDLSRHAGTLVQQYRLDEDAFRLAVSPGSPLIGTAPLPGSGSAAPGVVVIGAQCGSVLDAGDVLIVRGELAAVGAYAARSGLSFLAGPVADHVAGALLNRELGVAEVVVGPRSELVGDTAFPGMAARDGDLVVLAVQRKGYDQGPAPTTLAVGDTLLLQGTWQALNRHDDFLVVDSPSAVRRQAVPLGPGAKRALAVLIAMVVLLATGAVPPAVAGLLAAGAMVLLRVVTMSQAYRGISWTTIVIVGAMIPLSVAIQESGAAATLAHGLVAVVGDLGPYALLVGVFLLTAVLGQMISNMATALIVIPVAISAAGELGVSVRPVLMCVTIAAAASFLTPVATPANMMVMGPGGYRFGDYWKLGLPMLAWFFVVAVGAVPLFWPF